MIRRKNITQTFPEICHSSNNVGGIYNSIPCQQVRRSKLRQASTKLQRKCTPEGSAHNDMPVSKVMSFLSSFESNYFKFFLPWDPTGKIISPSQLIFSYFLQHIAFRFPKPIKSSGCLFFSDMLCSHLQSSLMSALAQDWKQQPLVNTGAKNITFPRWNNLFTLDWRFLSLSLFSKAMLNVSRSLPLTLMRQLHTDPGNRTSNALFINLFT